MKKLLVANRSEIAVRIFRSANELNLRTVAIYAEEDRFGVHRFRVDERLTSVAAAESLSVKSKGRKARKPADGRIDATAASLILRDFLEGKGA